MWTKRLLLQWLTIFVVCFIIGILIKIHMSPSFLVIREMEYEYTTSKSKPNIELNIASNNMDVKTITSSMLQPMDDYTINKTVITTEVICRRQMAVNSIPFIWDDDSHTWYNVTKSSKSSESETLDLADIRNLGRITMSLELVGSLEKNKRESYRILGKFLKNNGRDNLKLLKAMDAHSKWRGRIVTLTNVVVSSNGWIVDNKHCHAVINGGCKTAETWRPPKNPIQNYDRVISIAMFWGDGIWHFLLESFVGLAHVHTSECYIHVSSKNKWATNWLAIIGIPSNRIIDGTIAAKTLIVPEMGRCGAPSLTQINWLRTIIPSTIPQHPNSIILIKRTRSRVMSTFNAIHQLVENFANEQRLEFVLHDDSSLPSIPEQLQRFANASIIIGPHGAGMVNIIASKRRTCVIEFSPTDPNICYMRLSFLLGHNYIAIPLYKNQIVDVNEVKRALHLCRQS